MRADEEIQALVFDASLFTSAEAEAWASLHGFNHRGATLSRGRLVVLHQPRRAYEAETLREVRLPLRGVHAIVGLPTRAGGADSLHLSYLPTRRARQTYECYSKLLRDRALRGRTCVSSDSFASPGDSNADLRRWYFCWFKRTHPDSTAHERLVASTISRGLSHADRSHALDYVRKLGYTS